MAAITAKVPMMATGTAIRGMIAERQFCRNKQHHEGHQQHGVAERHEDFVDRFVDEGRGVVDDLVVHALGEMRLELLHLGADQAGGLEGVGAGQLVHRQRHRGAAVERAGLVVGLGAEFDAGDVAHADQAALVVVLEDHVGKLLGVDQPAQGGHGVLEFLPLGHRRLPDLAGGHLGVLLLDGQDHVAGRRPR